MENNPLINKGLNAHDKMFILINLFIKEGVDKIWSKSDYSRERFAAKRIQQEFPDFDFFYFIPEYNNKFNSLLGLLSAKVKVELKKKYKEFELKKETQKEFKLESKPVINIEEFKQSLDFKK